LQHQEDQRSKILGYFSRCSNVFASLLVLFALINYLMTEFSVYFNVLCSPLLVIIANVFTVTFDSRLPAKTRIAVHEVLVGIEAFWLITVVISLLSKWTKSLVSFIPPYWQQRVKRGMTVAFYFNFVALIACIAASIWRIWEVTHVPANSLHFVAVMIWFWMTFHVVILCTLLRKTLVHTTGWIMTEKFIQSLILVFMCILILPRLVKIAVRDVKMPWLWWVDGICVLLFMLIGVYPKFLSKYSMPPYRMSVGGDKINASCEKLNQQWNDF